MFAGQLITCQAKEAGVMRRIICIAGVFMLALMAACSDDDTPAGPAGPTPGYFPNDVGTKWTYAVYDSVRATVDTIAVTIADSVPVPGLGQTASAWAFSPSGRWEDRWIGNNWDTLLVVGGQVADSGQPRETVSLYQPGPAPFRSQIYVIPFAVGNHWMCPDCSDFIDSTHVEDTTTITTRAGTFHNVFRIKRIYSCGDECAGTLTIWFKPGVGVVLSNRVEWDIFDYPDAPQITASWELVEFRPGR